MEEEMTTIRVFTKLNRVWIEQQQADELLPDSILIHPDQVEILVFWLRKAVDELKSHKSKDELDGGG
jgi:hypothetical protein